MEYKSSLVHGIARCLSLEVLGFVLQYKLCKVRKIFVGTKGIPHLVTHDARTIRYPDPLIKVNDTVQIDLETGKITDFIKFDTGRSCMPLKHCTLPHRGEQSGS